MNSSITQAIKRGLCRPALLVAASVAISSTAHAEAWSLSKAAGSPDWLDFGGSYFARYESLNNGFKPGSSASDQILIHRTLLNASADLGSVSANVELIDSRQDLADSGSAVSTSMVDTLDFTEAYLAFDLGEALGSGSKTIVNVGRRTYDAGSRRLIARQRFGATLNAFDGVDLLWKSASGNSAQAFYFHPVNKEPSSKAELLDNDHEFDASTSNLKLYGVFSNWVGLSHGAKMDLYFVGLNEDDSDFRATKNRDFYTPGIRWYTKAAKGTWDYEVELMYQFGETRGSSSASDLRDLDQRAWAAHLEAGYTFNHSWKPRLAVAWDYASGDDDPNDGENNRFDKLYGVTRGDFNPTSLYGAVTRANINTPGYHLTFDPAKGWNVMIGERFVWLASDTDSFASVRDKTGSSGSYVGNQVETRIRYKVNDNFGLEFGGAYLMAGEFLKDAPNSPDRGDALYGYMQATVKF